MYLEKLNQLYYGFIALPLLLFPLVYLPMKDHTQASTGEALGDIFCYIAALLLFVSLFLGRRLNQRGLKQINEAWPLERRLKEYKKSSRILYTAGLLTSLISVALLWLTRHQLFVATYPILLLAISFYRPTIGRVKRELSLTDKELAMIKDHKQQI